MAEKMNKAGKKSAGVNPKVLESLIRQCETIKGEMDESRGELGAAIKNAEDTHGVHRKAFKLMLNLKKMDDHARGDFLRAFDDYREKLNLNVQTDMFDDEPASKGEPQDAGAATGEANAEAIREGIKPTGKKGASAGAVH